MQERTPIDLVAIETLAQWLDSFHQPEQPFPFWHGFLTAVACAPELIPPSAWMPDILQPGGKEYEFQSEQEAREKTGLLLMLYNDINQNVMVSPYLPYTDADGSRESLHIWCRGFIHGMPWWGEALRTHKQAITGLIAPITVNAADRLLN